MVRTPKRAGRKTTTRSRPRRSGTSRKTAKVTEGLVPAVPAVIDSAAALLRPGMPPEAGTRLDEITLSPRAAARLRQHFQNPTRRKRGTVANVLALHERGLTVTEIASTLELSPRTVSSHLARARRRGNIKDSVDVRYQTEIEHLAAEHLRDALLDGDTDVALAVAKGRGHLRRYSDSRQDGPEATNLVLGIKFDFSGHPEPDVLDNDPAFEGSVVGAPRTLEAGYQESEEDGDA